MANCTFKKCSAKLKRRKTWYVLLSAAIATLLVLQLFNIGEFISGILPSFKYEYSNIYFETEGHSVVSFERLHSSRSFLSHGISNNRSVYLLAESDPHLPAKGTVDMGYVKEMDGFKPVPYNSSKLKTILVYNNAYGSYDEGLKRLDDPKELLGVGCPEPNCVLTSNQSSMFIHEFDAIIFHYRATRLYDMPALRKPQQRWIFKATESAAYAAYATHRPGAYNDLFNWTMAYRLDSDIPIPYNLIRRRSLADIARFSSLAPKPHKKLKMAAWFVSNCRTASGRENILTTLKNYIEVDVYGHCGTLSCPRDDHESCLKMLEEDYYFYLSFENSLCKDYVTEKFFRLLKYRVIPVVYGSADYDAIAPPKSFINVLNFGSIKDLADYLIYLRSNETAYNEYFKWKDNYYIQEDFTMSSICHICYKLHHDQENKIYTDLYKWYVQEGSCKYLLSRFKLYILKLYKYRFILSVVFLIIVILFFKILIQSTLLKKNSIE